MNHGLPGQRVHPDPNFHQPLFDEQGYVNTMDEYAVFNGQVRRAGYISNYSYGYTMYHITTPWFDRRDASGFIANIFAGAKDNPADIQAMEDGWDQAERDFLNATRQYLR